MDCNLCPPSAWSGPECPKCSLNRKAHYLEGDSGGQNAVNFFCVLDSPTHPSVSGKVGAHAAWTLGVELTIKRIFEEYKYHLDATFAKLHTRWTHAIRCAQDKPVKEDILACAPLFHAELLQYAAPNLPIFIFAMGSAPLISLGFKVKKISDFHSRFFKTKLQERDVIIFSTFSRRDLAANPGKLSVFKTHISQFLSAVRDTVDGKTIKIESPIDQIIEKYHFPKTIQALRKLADEIVTYAPTGMDPDNYPIAIDTETNTLRPYRDKLNILTFAVAWGPGKAASIPVEHSESYFTFEEAASFIHRILTCKKPKILQNAKFDIQILRRKGWEINNFAWDTMLAEHLLEEDKKGYYDLKEIVRKRLPEYSNYEDPLNVWLAQYKVDDTKEVKKKRKKSGEKAPPKLKNAEKKLAEDSGYEHVPLSILNPYGAMDVDVTWQIAKDQRTALRKEDIKINQDYVKAADSTYIRNKVLFQYRRRNPVALFPMMQDQLLTASQVLSEMELTGVPVDRKYVEQLYNDLDASIMTSQININEMVPASLFDAFNPKSPHHLRTVIFNTGFRHPETGKVICYKGIVKPSLTATGAESVDAAFLKRLVTEQDCPLAKEVLIYRAMNKAKDPFVNNIRALSREDGKMHTTYNITGTSTGRLCVAEDTILDTDKGCFEISKLDLTKIQNISILSHAGKFRRIKNVFYKGREEMYRVTLENENSIEVTKNHRFFTPEGDKRLRELCVGSYVTTYENHNFTSQRRFSNRRKRLRGSLPYTTSTLREIQTTGNITKNNNQFDKILQTKIRYRNTGEKAPYVLHCTEREYTRKERKPDNNSTKGRTKTTFGHRVQYSRNCTTIKSKRLVCTSKYAVPFFVENRKTSLPHVGYRFRIPTGFGTIRTRTNGLYISFLRQSPRVLQKIIPDTLASYRTTVVCKRSSKGAQSLSRSRKSTQRSYLLEFESSRSNSLYGTARRRDTPYSASYILQKLYGRLWVSSYKTSGRSRRRISPERYFYSKARQTAKGNLAQTEVSSSIFYNPRSRAKFSNDYRTNTFSTCRIKSITRTGIKDVWDIEVEEDHSYVAQGFVNHNSSSGENMQNLPSVVGIHNIKKIFVPADRENNVFVNADAKAAEVRIYAAYSKDANLIKALNDGMDPHSFFAAMTYDAAKLTAGVPKEDHDAVLGLIGIDSKNPWSYEDFQNAETLMGSKTKPGPNVPYGKRLDALRTTIKRVVFGILYGASKNKISSIVGIPQDQSQAIIDSLFSMFPSIPVYIERTKEHLKEFNFVETFFGRRRRFDMRSLTSKLKAEVERKAVNFKIQSTSTDIVIRVLNRVAPIINHDLRGKILITVHDSIGFELPKVYVGQIPDLFETHGVRQVAIECPWLPVPFKWDIKVGPSYGELQKIKEYLSAVPHQIPHDELEFVDDEIKQQLAAAEE